MVGVGGGCLFVPALAVMTPHFNTRLDLAMGVTATGSSVGGIGCFIMFTNLIGRVGFGWTIRIIGFIASDTLSIPFDNCRMRTDPSGTRNMLDKSASLMTHTCCVS